jgi:hypothetical protein
MGLGFRLSFEMTLSVPPTSVAEHERFCRILHGVEKYLTSESLRGTHLRRLYRCNGQ